MKSNGQKIWQQVLPWLVWLGPALIVMGASAGFVSSTWTGVPLALVVAGFVIIVLWLLLGPSGTASFWQQRSTQTSTNAFAATLAVLVILGLINFLSVRYSARFDLSENQLFTLAPQSQQIIRTLKQPVKVWVFDKQPSTGARALLEQYQRQGQQFSFEFVDPQARPELAQNFQVQDFGDVYLEAKGRRQFVQSIKTDRLSESKLTNAIEQVNSDRQSKVYFLQGHGEHTLDAGPKSLSQAVTLLQEKNFTSAPLNLLQQTAVPADATVVVVAGPRQALFDREIKALEAYLTRGGSLLLMIDPNTDSKLDDFVKGWGVTLDKSIVINASERQVELGPAAPVINEYGDHPISRDFGNRFSVYPLARPLEIATVSGVEATPLLITNEESWAETNLQSGNLEFNPDQGDRRGPLVLGAAFSRSPAQPGQVAKTPRLVVIGNAAFAIDGLLTKQLNGDVFLNSISWLSKRDDQALSIRPREPRNRRITLNALQFNAIVLSSLLLLPLLGFITAGWIWWRRR